MKHLVWFLLHHNRLPRRPWLRRRLLQSIFRPLQVRDYGSGLMGWYDLGPNATPEQVERFKAWESERG
jgi:hypothetical protein